MTDIDATIDIQRYVDTTCLHYVGELCSLIINTMNKYNKVHIITKEQFSLRQNGFYDLLDQLCAANSWDKTCFTIRNCNLIEQHDQYKVSYIAPWKNLSRSQLESIPSPVWNREKTYGLFLGRANVTRLQAIKNHLAFRYRDQGLASYHADISKLAPSVLAQYLCETNSKWTEIEEIKPFSDIGGRFTPPIVSPTNIFGWQNVYQQIAIEIVCETAEDSSAVGITEKIVRPMLYRRPFLLIAGANFIETIKQPHIYKDKLGLDRPFDFFETLVPNYHDCFDGASRSNFVFDRLQELIASGRIQTVLEEFSEQIESNYQLAKSLYTLGHDTADLKPQTWSQPDY